MSVKCWMTDIDLVGVCYVEASLDQGSNSVVGVHAPESFALRVDRRLANSVLLRGFRHGRLLRLAKSRDRLLFAEPTLLHALPHWWPEAASSSFR